MEVKGTTINETIYVTKSKNGLLKKLLGQDRFFGLSFYSIYSAIIFLVFTFSALALTPFQQKDWKTKAATLLGAGYFKIDSIFSVSFVFLSFCISFLFLFNLCLFLFLFYFFLTILCFCLCVFLFFSSLSCFSFISRN